MRVQLAILLAAGSLLASASARAQTVTQDSLDDPSKTTPADPALDVSARPAPGEAVMTSRIATSADAGLWARAPARLPGLETPLVIGGGDVGLSSWLALRMYGFDDFMTHRFSGMSAGLEAWVLPKTSPVQLAVSGGYMETATVGAPAMWGQVSAITSFGLFRLGASLRAQNDLGNPSSLPGFTSVVSASYGNRIKIGVAWITEGGTGSTPTRQAIMPSISATTKSGRTTFGATSVIGVKDTPTVPIMLRVGGRF